MLKTDALNFTRSRLYPPHEIGMLSAYNDETGFLGKLGRNLAISATRFLV